MECIIKKKANKDKCTNNTKTHIQIHTIHGYSNTWAGNCINTYSAQLYKSAILVWLLWRAKSLKSTKRTERCRKTEQNNYRAEKESKRRTKKESESQGRKRRWKAIRLAHASLRPCAIGDNAFNWKVVNQLNFNHTLLFELLHYLMYACETVGLWGWVSSVSFDDKALTHTRSPQNPLRWDQPKEGWCI